MAKQRAKRARPSAVAEAAPQPAVCKLHSIPDSIDFGAATGDTVVIITHDHVGMVLMAKAEYGGQQLVPAGQATSRIEFDVLPGRNTLKLVIVFSASITGRGELREQCGEEDSQFLRELTGDEPMQLLRIIGS